MKNIAIYCVNYHSYDCLNDYLASVDTAMTQTATVRLQVFVADNSVPAEPVAYHPQHFSLQVMPTGENKGYFGAVHFLMDAVKPQEFDYVIVSNVDVTLAEDFFAVLSSTPVKDTTAWLAPAILSQTLQFDFNPQTLRRYSLRKMKTLRFMFRHPRLLRLKQKLFHVYRDVKAAPFETIYAGHGSFIILTRAFFSKQSTIDYPLFLYGEEIYLAELCRRHQLDVCYFPQARVYDIGRVSTGRFSSKTYCQYNHRAIDYLIKTFYQHTS